MKRKIMGISAAVGSAMASAAVDPTITKAISDTGTDLMTAIGAIMAAMIGAWGLKKLAGKMGWM